MIDVDTPPSAALDGMDKYLIKKLIGDACNERHT
jgi:hypothetical protein